MNEIENVTPPEDEIPDSTPPENDSAEVQEKEVKEASPQTPSAKKGSLRTTAQNVNVQGDADTVVTIANLQNLTLGLAVDQRDPTTEFPTTFSKAKPYLSPSEVTDFAQKLMREHLLLVASSSSEAADNAVFALLNCPELGSLERRLLSRERFDAMAPAEENENDGRKSEKGHEDGPGLYKTAADGIFSLDNLLGRKINKERPSIIVAAPESRSFINSILRCNDLEEADYRQQLAQKNLFLIVKVDNSMLLRRIQENAGPPRFPHWQVSSLRFMLYQEFEPAEAHEYEIGLESQRLRGGWGEEAEAGSLAKDYLARGKSAFKSKFFELQQILDDPNSEAARAAEEKRRNLMPEAFLSRTKNPVAFHLAFLGAWFEKMTVTEFDRLAFLLFDDEKKRHEVGKKKRQINLRDGSIETIEEPDYRPLLSLWRGREDEFREEAQLTTMRPQRNSFRYVEFVEPYLRDEVRKFFEEKYAYFAAQNFDLIFKIVFFDENAAPGFVKNLAKLNAQMALQEPSQALSRLTEISFKIHRDEQRSDAEAVEQLEKSSDLSDIFRLLKQSGESQRVKYLFFQRIYLLVSEFWDDEDLRDVVEKFLDRLLWEGNFEPVHFLTNQMWNAPAFKPMFWARQLIERGDETAKNSTFRLLIHRLSQEPSDTLWKYLEDFRDALPERKVLPAQFSRFHEYALAFIIHFTTASSADALPASAKTSSLLAPLFDDSDGGIARWEKLLGWLFHPGIGAAMVKVEREYRFQDPAPFRAFVLGHWFWQLHGSDDPLSGQTESIIRQMFCAIPSVTSLREYRPLLDHLRDIAHNYRENRETRPRYYALQLLVQLLRDRNPFAT